MSTFEEKLIKAVKEKREKDGLSLRALSTVVGVSFSTLARMERHEGQPDNNSKIRLLQWLGQAADDAGLGFENVAYVHFRAGKNIGSTTVRTLLKASDSIRKSFSADPDDGFQHPANESLAPEGVSLSKEELENIAEKFRQDLGLDEADPVESLRIEIDGVRTILVRKADFLDPQLKKVLTGQANTEWSAMSVPLDAKGDNWAVLLNDCHRLERQRVTVLEEYWHIMLGHKLTKIAKVAEAYGRTYDKTEEHDAYYLASATLLPRLATVNAVNKKMTSEQIGKMFGTSSELVDYRVKRLGLWREHVGKAVRLSAT
jgi:transcriptional regulator with XRE-family HTH domain